MENIKQNKYSAEALLAEFFAQDDLKSLAADAGALLELLFRCLCWMTRFMWLRITGRLGFLTRFFRRPSAAVKSPMKPAPLSAEAKR